VHLYVKCLTFMKEYWIEARVRSQKQCPFVRDRHGFIRHGVKSHPQNVYGPARLTWKDCIVLYLDPNQWTGTIPETARGSSFQLETTTTTGSQHMGGYRGSVW
jgi:hypothetical protein